MSTPFKERYTLPPTMGAVEEEPAESIFSPSNWFVYLSVLCRDLFLLLLLPRTDQVERFLTFRMTMETLHGDSK